MTKNIGVKVKEPKRECSDKNCPFHGGLSIRGKLFDGKVTGNKANRQSHYKKKSQFTLVNSKDMQEVKVQFMHTYQDALISNQVIMY